MNEIKPPAIVRPAYADAAELLADCVAKIRECKKLELTHVIEAGHAVKMLRGVERSNVVIGMIYKGIGISRKRASDWAFLYDHRADVAGCKSVNEAMIAMGKVKVPSPQVKTQKEVKQKTAELPTEAEVFPPGDLEAQSPPETAQSVIADVVDEPGEEEDEEGDDLGDAIFDAAIKQQQREKLDEHRAQSAPLPTEKKKARSALGIVVRACYDVGIYDEVREALNKIQAALDALKG